MPLAWIALNSVKGLGPVKIKQLIDHFGSAEAVLKCPAAELRRGGVIPEACIGQILDKGILGKAEEQLGLALKSRVSVLTMASKNYPPYLKEIFAPPAVLFVKGNVSVFSQHAVGVVGTRRPTVYGRGVTRAIVKELVGQGLAIASGLAMGIDTEAHHACIEAGGRTIAVLGCGIDQVYPKNNLALADTIIETGALVSEFPMGTPPNRLISRAETVSSADSPPACSLSRAAKRAVA